MSGIAVSHEGFAAPIVLHADGFGSWHARVVFDGIGIGNSPEAHDVRRRAEHEARRLIVNELARREQKKHETYESAWRRQADALRLDVHASHEAPSVGTLMWIEWVEADRVECAGACMVEYSDGPPAPADATPTTPGAGAVGFGFVGDYEGQPDVYVCDGCGGEVEQ